jgi:hypothetical protein
MSLSVWDLRQRGGTPQPRRPGRLQLDRVLDEPHRSAGAIQAAKSPILRSCRIVQKLERILEAFARTARRT